ncbi:MAG: baseplate J/gp47 family protein [Azoarcus sp.]|jgi:uncharacterized phage protein gp47/JayE|nr:baseplate J/gp47 family protein [Azoarcus sp.]
MPDYPRPSLDELARRIRADLAGLPAALLTPLARAWAEACHGLHGYVAWADKQNNPLTCELERLYDWAALYDVERLDATPASGSADARGTPGSVILAGTRLRGPNGIDYVVIGANFMANTGVAAVSLRAEQTGEDTNLPAGAELTLIDPIPGIAPTFTVGDAGLTGGAAEEDIDDWRLRVIDQWQAMTLRGARGGRDDDYRDWAMDAHPAVTGALVFPHALGLGSVVVHPVCDGNVNRQPTPAVIAAVEQLLESVAPATADWRVAPPLILPVTVSLHLDPAVDTTEARERIARAVLDTVLAEKTETAVLYLAELDAGIATVTSQYTRYEPAQDIAVTAGEILVLSEIAWR